jgi:RNA polymerase sigma-70 factor (ECF subfamily)
VRSGRGLRDEFSAFYASAYPELVAQLLAITGDAGLARAATATTLAKAWRSWPTLRQAADPLVRARWSAVMVAAEHQSTAKPRATKSTRAVVDDGGEVTEDAVLLAALRLLPPVQRRALVLHYMGGVSVNHLAALSGSSAEHVELLLDDGFTALADSLDWADEPAADPDADGDPRRRSGRRHPTSTTPRPPTTHSRDGDVAPSARLTCSHRRRPGRRSRPALRLTAEALADTAAAFPPR